MLLCLGEPPRRFLWCCCSSFHFCIFISVLIFISFLFFICRCSSFCCCSSFTFSFRRHPSPFRGLWPGFYIHFIISPYPRVIRGTFIFRYFLAASATALSGHFLPTDVFYLTLLHRQSNLRLSRFPWEPVVLPGSLQGFILILKTQTQPILFVWFTVIHNLHIQNDSVLNSTIY